MDQDYEKRVSVHAQSTETWSDREGSSLELTEFHREYLLKRHGTLDLDPLPSEDPEDPLNWPSWKKNLNLAAVSLQAMGGVIMCSSMIPGAIAISEAFNTSFTNISYCISVPILFLGIATVVWKPLANRYGRRPIWLLSSFLSGAFSLGSVYCNSYGALMTTRVLSGITFAPALAIGGATIGETFFAKERAGKIELWSLAFTIGPSIGPLFGGIAIYHTGNWRWCFWLLVIWSYFCFVLAIVACPETLYIRNIESPRKSSVASQYIKFGRINKAKFSWMEILEPYIWIKYLPVAVAALAHGMCNTLTSPGITIVLPKIYTEVYGLNAQQVGLQYIAMTIGLIIGEQVGGPLSDFMMKKHKFSRDKGNNERNQAEFRLWAGYLGFALVVCGVLVYGIMLSKAEKNHWTIVPDLGIAISAVGNQIVATVVITYAIDKMHVVNAGTVSNCIHQYRQLWGFIAPFFFNPMYDNLGIAGAGGLMAGLMALSALPMVFLHIFGRKFTYNVVSSDAEQN